MQDAANNPNGAMAGLMGVGMTAQMGGMNAQGLFQMGAQQKAAAPAAAPVAAAPANGEKLLSPFPGLIKALLVENGATVKKDQPVLVLEAMKMDNDITAPCDGVITYQVQKGANVESDSVLAVIG